MTSTGRPIAAMCAMKFRLPKVPPGARAVLASSLVTRPYAWMSPVDDPMTTDTASAVSSRCPWPARVTDRADQKSAAPASDTPHARKASHGLSAKRAEIRDSARNPLMSASAMKTVSPRAAARQESTAASAAASSTSSFTKV